MKILIVDSSIWIPDRIVTLLTETRSAKTLYKALSYGEACTLFEENKPEIVILDKNLPDNGSITFLKEIKSANKGTVVIVLSLRIDPNTEYRCKMAGADFFLDKYSEFEKIPAIIDGLKAGLRA